jgi:predicted O-linked N-acetylglucosamine transferase (SPINDLY family)
MDSSNNRGISGNEAVSRHVKKQLHSPQLEKEALVTLFSAGRYSQAEVSARRLTERYPDDHFGWNVLGTILAQSKRSQEAIPILERALGLSSNDVSSINSLAFALQDLDRDEEALSRFVQALELNPYDAMVHNNMGNILQKLGKFDEAHRHYAQALKIKPNNAEAHNNMGNTLKELGRFEEALQYYAQALEMKPNNAVAHNNMGNTLRDLGRDEEALSHYAQALAIKPDIAEAHINMGSALRALNRYAEALPYYTQALEIDPNYAHAYGQMGFTYHNLGRLEKAIRCFNKALEIEPGNMISQFGRCFSKIPVLYETAEEIPVRRDQYRLALLKLRKDLLPGSRVHIDAAAEAVGSKQPFLLAYQGYNNRELQRIYGDLICTIQAKKYPQWSKFRPMPPITADEKIRVGIVSGFFYNHSNWKIPIQGWVEQLDRQRFSIHGYYTGRKKDQIFEKARRSFDRFSENCFSLERLCKTITNDRLHVLIFPEIGMDPLTARLASLRLAPIQCTSWGHPDTSGLSTIDYYLSSDLMEPHDADSHYTERLIRLPNLSIYYYPQEIQSAQMDRSLLGLPPDAVLYFSPQSLFKYLPQYDHVFPRIAKQVDRCRFLFIKHPKSSHLDERFVARLKKAFAKYGLRENDYVSILPRLNSEQYQAMNRLCDVFLDSLGWSGCNSTMEALANDLPVVSMPGDLMRGRHSHAILTMMGTTETIAGTLDEYIDLAVRLGTECQFRKRVREKISKNKHKVYRDSSCINALEAFLKKKVAAALQN